MKDLKYARPSSTAQPGRPARKAKVMALSGRSEKDAALMRRIQGGGDRAAFEELALHYGPRLKAWLIKRGEHSATAEDIAQDVLIVSWQKASLFDPSKASFATWIFRLTRNRWIDHQRKHGRMTSMEPDLIAVLADEPVDCAHTVMERTDAAEAVRQELALLPPEQKQMLHLAFFEGLSHSQIAERTGTALGTVKSRIRVPLKRLQERLSEHKGVWS